MRCHPNILPTYVFLVAYELPFGVNKTFKVIKNILSRGVENYKKLLKLIMIE